MRTAYKFSLAATALVVGASLLVGQPATAAEVKLPQLAFGPLGAVTNIVSADVFVVATDDTLNSMAVGSSTPLYEVDNAPLRVQDGNFQADLDPSNIPDGYLSDQGVAFMKIMLHTADAATYQTGLSARLVNTADGPLWVDPNENLDAFVTAPQGTAAKSSAGTTPTADVSEYEYEDDGVLAPPPISLVASGGPTAPQGCSYTKLDSDVRSATIGTTYPLDGDVASMTVTSSAGAEYGTAVSAKGPSGYGDFRAAEAKFTKSGWGFTWADSTSKRSYRKGIQYGLYELSCVQGCTKCARQWFPTGETGGTGSNTGIVRPTWNTYCAPEDKGTFWRDRSDGNSYAYGAGVKFANVIGIDLSVDRNYTSSQKISYAFSVKRRLCGNNDYPATAGKLLERLAS